VRERGIVTKVDGAAVTVRISGGEGCASCTSGHDCSIVGKELVGDAPAGVSFAAGDEVELVVPDSASAAGALWLLAVPLGLFFAGYAAGAALWPGRGEGPRALLGLVAMALGLLFAAVVARRGRMSRRPTVVPLVS